ncbi:MAG TPA: 30S ribosomal protein S4 [Firmicutes bacterium]|jgi:small subunit ribosomal protein S4|nr:30S ribosomal protein S4 [Bacillota bacterium]HAV19735.1 30S ribosomal protein S4 [Bacillota bacterium]
MRFTGSDWKRSRRLRFSTLETGKELVKRNYGPGQHGNARKRKPSEYGKQLLEKQKLRFMYGVNERQFRRMFTLAVKSSEVTGLAFMQILESRLDNLVYRMGFARTRKMGRQLVNHGHITVNGKKVDIPSYLCSINDTIAIAEKSNDLIAIKAALDSVAGTLAYVSIDKEKLTGKFIRFPERGELPQDINESQIVEYYNRLL